MRFAKKIALSLLLTLACVLSGFAFYRFNGGQTGMDVAVASAFAFGLTGIMLSVLRNRKGG